MSTTPPEQPGGTARPPGDGDAEHRVAAPGCRFPGNAEFLLYVVIEIVFVLIWIIADSVDTQHLGDADDRRSPSFYILSRGIAKASRVLEQ